MDDDDADHRGSGGRHGAGPVQYWDGRHAAESAGYGLATFIVMTLFSLAVRDIPLLARIVVGGLTAVVMYLHLY